jgi:hypothetical protein
VQFAGIGDDCLIERGRLLIVHRLARHGLNADGDLEDWLVEFDRNRPVGLVAGDAVACLRGENVG